MSPRAQFWVLIVALAAGTWAMRSLPIMTHGHIPHPPWLERVLKHVPVAALTAPSRSPNSAESPRPPVPNASPT